MIKHKQDRATIRLCVRLKQSSEQESPARAAGLSRVKNLKQIFLATRPKWGRGGTAQDKRRGIYLLPQPSTLRRIARMVDATETPVQSGRAFNPTR
jgi:hypothetical protein